MAPKSRESYMLRASPATFKVRHIGSNARAKRVADDVTKQVALVLRLVFDAVVVTCGVYLFDEFDAIGSDRGRNDVGAMRRVLNSFPPFLKADDSDSPILATMNHQKVLDPALFRRFDDVTRYGLPNDAQVEQLARNRLNSFGLAGVNRDEVRAAATGSGGQPGPLARGQASDRARLKRTRRR